MGNAMDHLRDRIVGEAAGVARYHCIEINVVPHTWRYAEEKAADIAAFWQRSVDANAALFDGIVHLLACFRNLDGTLSGEAFATRFRNFLYWRHQGYEDRSVWDAFGSAVLRSHDGGLLLGRQRPGFVNEGLYYLPGGFIDTRDVLPSGRIDFQGSVLREVEEETGLDASSLETVPGAIVTHHAQQISIGIELRSPLGSDDLRSQVLARINRVDDPELDDVMVATDRSSIKGLPMADFCRELVPFVLDEAKG